MEHWDSIAMLGSAIFVLVQFLKRIPAIAQWRGRKVLYPTTALSLGIAASFTGFLPGDSWQEQLTCGVLASGSVILGWNIWSGLRAARGAP